MVDVIESKEELVDYLKSIKMFLKDNPDALEETDYRKIQSMINRLEVVDE